MYKPRFPSLPQRFLFEIEQIGLEKGLVDINSQISSSYQETPKKHRYKI